MIIIITSNNYQYDQLKGQIVSHYQVARLSTVIAICSQVLVLPMSTFNHLKGHFLEHTGLYNILTVSQVAVLPVSVLYLILHEFVLIECKPLLI